MASNGDWTRERIRLVAPSGNTMTGTLPQLAPLSKWMRVGWRTADLHVLALLSGSNDHE